MIDDVLWWLKPCTSKLVSIVFDKLFNDLVISLLSGLSKILDKFANESWKSDVWTVGWTIQ